MHDHDVNGKEDKWRMKDLKLIARKMLVHNCNIFLCSLDVRNYDQCGGPNIKEKGHLEG